MPRYISRKCPSCRDRFGVVVNELASSDGEHPIKGYCTGCGYRLKGWRLILGGKRPTEAGYARMPKVFR